ncbi:hypothetical protein B0H13DRAFT_685906 [Mycena leptocephala]|nr:hypothetical protein B0H13DRAFT_685906 [Mycena leptocephala]
MSESERNETFPRRLPVDQPPALRGVIVNGAPTPRYALAWVCPSRTFYMNMGGGKLGIVTDRDFSDAVSRKWNACPGSQGFKFGLRPLPYPGPDGNFYLIAMFNDPDADHATRVGDVAGDPLIQAARISMGVDADLAVDETLQWFRWS